MQINDSTRRAVKARTPVYMVGIDGADWKLLQRLMSAGKLPALARLKQQGSYGELDSPADAYAGGVWPDFYTGQPVAHHGIYHNKLWRQERMRCETPIREWLSSRPFYEELSQQGYRVCVLDMPMVLDSPRALNGINLGGWGTHDLIAKGSSPSDLWRQLQSRYGKPVMPAECFGRQSMRSLLLLRDQLILSTEQMAAISVELMGSESWDFACVIFGAAHRAGHYLWDDSQLEKASRSDRKEISAALEAVYVACDEALAQVLSVAPSNALKVVFAVHGMKQNHGWGDLCNDLLEEIFRETRQRKPKRGLFYEVRRRLPFGLVRPLLTRLPQSVNRRLLQLWSANMYEWLTTPYFPLPMDQAGYIRINLEGREKNGIVAPGEAYLQLCAELERYLLSLQDMHSGQAIVANVVRAWRDAPQDAPARDLLPDLVVVWAEPSSQQSSRVVSHLLPGFSVKAPDYNLSGRSGNHAGYGWFLAEGGDLSNKGGINSGQIEGYSIRDLVPAIFDTMGAKPLEHFEGRTSLWQG